MSKQTQHHRNRPGNKHNRARQRRGRAMYITLVGVVALSLLAILGFSGTGSGPSANVAEASGTLSVETAFHDFGRISMQDGTVQYRYRLVNDSGEPALIAKLYTSCMCTEATLITKAERLGPYGMPGHGPIPTLNRVVPPGEAVTVLAQFDPNAHGPAGIGRNDRAVAVVMAGQRALELKFTAYVTP